jgi:geranylgeranyl reductase family protein
VRDDFDVLIAGAGPAGSHAAALLARRGLRIALLDRARFPRDKVCGGGLSRKTLDLLGPDVSSVSQRNFTGAILAWQDRARFVKDVQPVAGCTVLRSEFDAWLVERACTAGARFVPEARVQQVEIGEGVCVRTSRGPFSARLLLAADGVASTVRDQVFGRGLVRYAPAIEALLPAGAERLAALGPRVLLDLGGMPRGYGWIFPKRDHLNVGVYSMFGARGLRAHLDVFLRRHGLAGRAGESRVQGYAIPVCNVARVYERGPVWLLGDAAGFAESVWGEGIYFALKSAALAARAIESAAARARPGDYTRLIRAELEPELCWSRRVARLLYAAGPLAFDVLARNTVVCAWFAGLITGEVGYRSCFWRTLLGAPAWLLAPRFPLDRQPPSGG